MTYSTGQQHLSYGPHFLEDENKIILDSIWLVRILSASLFHNFIHLPEERNLWIQQLTGNTTNDDYLYNLKVLSLPFIWEHLHSLSVSLSSAEQQPNCITQLFHLSSRKGKTNK